MNESLNIWHPFTQRALDPAPLRVARGEGVYLHTDNGRKIIDGISSWWVNLHGHSHPAIAAAIAEQADKLEHVIFAGFTHPPAEELAARLRAVLPREMEHIFFSDNGSTAVEVALKMAVQYWHNMGHPEKREIAALEHAYHGDTAGAMSVSADSRFTGPFAAMRFPVHRAHSAYCYQCPAGKKRETCAIDCAASLESLLAEKHQRIAAVIVEPLLQGAGGMIIHPAEFLQKVRALCTKYDVLLIADEVLTGFGRCGKMFACDVAGIVPDLMCLSKGMTGGFLPLGATVTAGFIEEAFVSEDRGRTFLHGHSYTGNPIACAAAIASLKVFEDEPVMKRIETIARIHRERLAAIRGHEVVGDVRSIGTMAAIELRADDPGYFSRVGRQLYDFFLSRDVLLRPLGNVIYVLPPYVIKPAELHRIHDTVAEALDQVKEWI